MAVARASGIAAATLMLVAVSSGMAVQNTTAQNVTLPPAEAFYFNTANYSLPLLSNATHAPAEFKAANGTISPNVTIESADPTANYWDVEQNPKYVLPVPIKNASVPHAAAKGAKIESAAPSSATSVAPGPSRTSASIEDVPGFVKTQGHNFVLNGRAAYFAGTNAW